MNNIDDYCRAFGLLLPEIFVVLAIVFASLWNLFVPKLKSFTPIVSLIGLALAFCSLVLQTLHKTEVLFNGLYTIDPLTISFGLIVVTVGMIVVFMTSGYEHHLGNNAGEFYAILLTAVLAVMLLAGSTDLIMLFVGIETLTICCVLLAGFTKKDQKSSEASLKYLLSTAATTATLLYGLSFIYGLTGSTNYDVIHEQMAYLLVPPTSLVKMSLLVMFTLVLLMSTIGFKLAAVPFHMWAPDVYEGAPTPVTAFLSIGSKAGGIVVALRLLMVVFSNAALDWGILLSVLSALSMIVGNFIALPQNSFKRMLAYSSIAHIGYMLIGLITTTEAGLSAMVFYMIVYGVMNLGAFAGAILFSNETGSDSIDDFAGLIRKRPGLAILLSVCLLNLAGLPIPPAGFFAKLFVFGAGMSIPFVIAGIPIGPFLVGVGLLTSIPAIYYYTRVVIKMIVQEPSPVVANLPDRAKYIDSPQGGLHIALVSCVFAIFAASTFLVDPIMNFAHNSVRPVVPGMERTNPISSLPHRSFE